MPLLDVSEDEIVTLLTQLEPDARSRVLNRFAVVPHPITSGKQDLPDSEGGGVLDYLDSLPPVQRTAEEWARIERELTQEKDAWDR